MSGDTKMGKSSSGELEQEASTTSTISERIIESGIAAPESLPADAYNNLLKKIQETQTNHSENCGAVCNGNSGAASAFQQTTVSATTTAAPLPPTVTTNNTPPSINNEHLLRLLSQTPAGTAASRTLETPAMNGSLQFLNIPFAQPLQTPSLPTDLYLLLHSLILKQNVSFSCIFIDHYSIQID